MQSEIYTAKEIAEQIVSKFEHKDPESGDLVYVPDYKPEGKGIENRNGGIGTIEKVTKGYLGGEIQHWICVKEHNSTGFLELQWEGFIKEKQREWMKRYGFAKAHSKPDSSPNNNFNVNYYRL